MRRRDCARQVSRFGKRPAPRRLLRFRRQSDFCSLPGRRSLPATVGERKHSLRLSAQSLITFFLMARGLGRYVMPLLARDTTRVVSRRQEDFGVAERFFGRALTAFIFQITQRDVIYFVFLLLAIAGRASWILHIVFAFSVITLLFRLFRRSWRLAAE